MSGEVLKRVKVEYEEEEEIAKLNQSLYENLKRAKVEDEEEDEIGKLFMGIMEGYKDSVIPALSELQFVSESSENSQICRIVLGKREKRERITDNFAALQSMVPSITANPKASKETIAVEATKYIMSLKNEVSRLEDLKRSRRPALSACSSRCKPSVTTSVCNDDVAFFAVRSPARKGLLYRLSAVFHKFRAEVFEVTVFVDDQRVLNLTGTFTILKNGNGISDTVQKIKEEILVL